MWTQCWGHVCTHLVLKVQSQDTDSDRDMYFGTTTAVFTQGGVVYQKTLNSASLIKPVINVVHAQTQRWIPHLSAGAFHTLWSNTKTYSHINIQIFMQTWHSAGNNPRSKFTMTRSVTVRAQLCGRNQQQRPSCGWRDVKRHFAFKQS